MTNTNKLESRILKLNKEIKPHQQIIDETIYYLSLSSISGRDKWEQKKLNSEKEIERINQDISKLISAMNG